MSLSKDSNNTVAIALKQYGQKYILHIIDLATRYSNAALINSRHKDVVVENIIRMWVNSYGVPDKILTDNGGEFNNEGSRDMSENLNTEVLATAAESPWSNGISKRHNAVIDKIKDESDVSTEVALACAINAKNSLHNVYGFSPSQLVFGRNTNLPSVLNDKLPALGGHTSSEVVANHLNAEYETCKAFIECEASEKI